VCGRVTSMSEKIGKSGTLIFVTSEFTYTNQNDELLAKHTVTMIASPRKEQAQ
jgi:hypothetical protein